MHCLLGGPRPELPKSSGGDAGTGTAPSCDSRSFCGRTRPSGCHTRSSGALPGRGKTGPPEPVRTYGTENKINELLLKGTEKMRVFFISIG